MSRKRPRLEDWDPATLTFLETTDPRSWVEAVLTDARKVGQARSWPFGHVREAIRQELDRREPALDHFNVAHIRTQRGLAALRREGLIQRSGDNYRFPKRHRYGEMLADLARKLAKGRGKLTVKQILQHRADGAHAVELTISFEGPDRQSLTFRTTSPYVHV